VARGAASGQSAEETPLDLRAWAGGERLRTATTDAVGALRDQRREDGQPGTPGGEDRPEPAPTRWRRPPGAHPEDGRLKAGGYLTRTPYKETHPGPAARAKPSEVKAVSPEKAAATVRALYPGTNILIVGP